MDTDFVNMYILGMYNASCLLLLLGSLFDLE